MDSFIDNEMFELEKDNLESSSSTYANNDTALAFSTDVTSSTLLIGKNNMVESRVPDIDVTVKFSIFLGMEVL